MRIKLTTQVESDLLDMDDFLNDKKFLLFLERLSRSKIKCYSSAKQVSHVTAQHRSGTDDRCLLSIFWGWIIGKKALDTTCFLDFGQAHGLSGLNNTKRFMPSFRQTPEPQPRTLLTGYLRSSISRSGPSALFGCTWDSPVDLSGARRPSLQNSHHFGGESRSTGVSAAQFSLCVQAMCLHGHRAYVLFPCACVPQRPAMRPLACDVWPQFNNQ